MNTFVTLLLLGFVALAAFGQEHQGGPHQSQGGQGRIRREAEPDPEPKHSDSDSQPANWTTCDFLNDPRLSCHDCNTMLICKPVGGLLIRCKNPYRSHCNNGTCSFVPSPECA